MACVLKHVKCLRVIERVVIKLLITKRDELVLTENAPAEVQVVGTR